MRVYLVEDHSLIRESVHARLELEPDIEVVGEAGDAEHALSDLETLDVDVVLMDIKLPGMNGIEATSLLKVKRPNLAVIMLTAFQDGSVERAIEAGASGYILKTCTTQQLVQAIQATRDGQATLDPSLIGRLMLQVAGFRKSNGKSPLTDRQVEILRHVADGVRYKVIANHIFVSETTVNREMRTIFDRLGVNDAVHAVSEAYKIKIL